MAWLPKSVVLRPRQYVAVCEAAAERHVCSVISTIGIETRAAVASPLPGPGSSSYEPDRTCPSESSRAETSAMRWWWQSRKAEPDIDFDSHLASSRDLGGVEDATATDQGSTTGTTPTESFVGRVAGQDIGSFEEQGAERRAAADD